MSCGLDLLQHAETVFVEIPAPSRLGTSLVSVVLIRLGIDEDDPIHARLCRRRTARLRVPHGTAGAAGPAE
jgi:hypothetical protein